MKNTSSVFKLIAFGLALLTLCGGLFSCKRPDADTSDTNQTSGGITLDSTPDSTPSETTPVTPEQTTDQTSEPTTEGDALLARFADPEMNDYPTPLWFWNAEVANMSEATVRTLVREYYKQSGYSGFAILPWWQKDFLTEDYFKLYGAALDEGAKLGMNFILYDENGFPSYNAGGLVAASYPDLTAKKLNMYDKTASGGTKVTLNLPNGQLMSAVAMNTATFERIDITSYASMVDPKTAPGYNSSSDFSGDYDAVKAFDGSYSTRWNSANNTHAPQYLQVNFGTPRTVDIVKIWQAYQRISSFEIQYLDGAEWKTAYKSDPSNTSPLNDCGGTSCNQSLGNTINFAAVTTTAVRFVATGIANDPGKTGTDLASLWELGFYNGSVKQTPDSSTSSKLEYTVPSGGQWRVMAFVLLPEPTRDGIDYLSREAVRAYIDVTYEAYYARFSEYFGTTIKMAFYDEPSMFPFTGITPSGVEGARFWTPKFNEEFAARNGGASAAPDYPALFIDIGEETSAARGRLFGVRNELFAYNYVGQINEWCFDHGIELTGHMNEEERVNPLINTGDLMLAFKYQAVPGVDLIYRHGFSQEAYKIISSSANNWDKGRVMCEAFGAWNTTDIKTFYKSSMDLFAKGINYIVPHAVWYDTSRVHFPYELSYRDANFKSKMVALNTYIARAQTLLQNSRHVADIAVLYPIYDLDAAFTFDMNKNTQGQMSYCIPSWSDYMNVGEVLSLDLRHDFTYLHPEVLNEKVTVSGKTLRLNNEGNYEEYKVLVIPGMEVISVENLRKIKTFYDNGGTVIATTKLPTKGTRIQDNAEVIAIINHIFGTDPTVPDTTSRPTYHSSSNFNSDYAADKAFDGVKGDGSRWNSKEKELPCWLEVRFPEAATVSSVKITERFDRINAYKLQIWDGSKYVDVASGNKIGADKSITFTAVTTNRVRLYVTSLLNQESISIEEFEVYGTGGENLAIGGGSLRTNANSAGGSASFIVGGLSGNLDKVLTDSGIIFDVTIERISTSGEGSLQYIHKVKDGRNIYFFANSSDAAVSATVTLRGYIAAPELWNPYDGTGKAAAVEYKTIDGVQTTVFTLKLKAVDSVFLIESK